MQRRLRQGVVVARPRPRLPAAVRPGAVLLHDPGEQPGGGVRESGARRERARALLVPAAAVKASREVPPWPEGSARGRAQVVRRGAVDIGEVRER
ncbi:hypothetical protein STTU_0119 [Streptomyces sp. Tu6071]|nr:hypothetical protein STTU_0119 [Streptomyces sp. Tu6071]